MYCNLNSTYWTCPIKRDKARTGDIQAIATAPFCGLCFVTAAGGSSNQLTSNRADLPGLLAASSLLVYQVGNSIALGFAGQRGHTSVEKQLCFFLLQLLTVNAGSGVITPTGDPDSESFQEAVNLCTHYDTCTLALCSVVFFHHC